MKYKVGDQVWHATFESSTAWVTCPDCLGHGRLRVIMGDETEVSIECRACQRGYEAPTGRLPIYTHAPRAKLETIIGAEIEGEKVEWRTQESYRVNERDLFDNEADCMRAAQAKAEQFDRGEIERIARKEKDTKSWSWNAIYHRRCIREAESQIEYHRKKLAVASVKAKEAKLETANE